MWIAIIPETWFLLGIIARCFRIEHYDRSARVLAYILLAGLFFAGPLTLATQMLAPTQEVFVGEFSLVEMGVHNSPRGSTIYIRPVETDEGTLYNYSPKDGRLAGTLSEYASRTKVIYSTTQPPQVKRYAVEPKYKLTRLLAPFDEQGRIVIIIPPGGIE